MADYTYYHGKKLRNGYTTGSCATACAKAAALYLLEDQKADYMRILLPPSEDPSQPKTLDIPILTYQKGEGWAQASCRKDGGDDIDATHGMEIQVRVETTQDGQITIDGGHGIGRVTKEGLAEPVGAAAINPVPRAMIRKNLEEYIQADRGLKVLVSAPQGEEVAKRTMNGALGILGGISILGTTGIVRPMSEASLIASIQLDLSVKYHEGQRSLALVPGNYGLDFASQAMGIDPNRIVSMSNFAGSTLDQAQVLGFQEILLVGHLGKFVKLAAGIFQTHSHVADARMEILTAYLGLLGMPQAQLQAVFASNTTEEACDLIDQWGYGQVYDMIADRIQARCQDRLRRNGGELPVDVVIFSSEKGLLAATAPFDELCQKWRAL